MKYTCCDLSCHLVPVEAPITVLKEYLQLQVKKVQLFELSDCIAQQPAKPD